MISVQEVVVDPDMIAPQPYTILRSTGQFVLGGFQSVTAQIPMFGPVQQASDKELQMLPEADRIGSVRSFWSTRPIYTTRGYAPVPGTHGEAPVSVGESTYALSTEPPSDSLCVYANGLLLRPGVDYSLDGATLAFFSPLDAAPYAAWQVTVNAATNASDQIRYDSETYRVMQTYFDPGGGYFKALATRLAAA